MSLKRKLKEIKDEEKKKYSTKQVHTKLIIKKVLNPHIVFIMKGDAIVCFDDIESDRFSKLNIFKRINECIYQKEHRYIEIEMSNTIEGISDFRHVVKMLKSQPTQYMHEFGNILEKHQTFVDRQILMADQMRNDPNFNILTTNLIKNSQLFEEKVKIKIKEMEERGEIKFYAFKIIKTNTETFLNEIRKYCISELFLALMGLTVEQAQSFIMRKGIFDSSNIQRMCQHVKFFLNIANERIENTSIDSSLKTFDGIVIQVKIKYQIIYCSDLLNSPSSLFDKTEFAQLASFEVSDAMLQQVMTLRQNTNFNFQLYENEQDWDYSEEVEKFLQAYYEMPQHRKRYSPISLSSNQISSSLIQPTQSSLIFNDYNQ